MLFRRFLIVLVCVAGLAAACLIYAGMRGYTVELTEGELQQRLVAGFPIRKTYLGLVDVALSNPVLKLYSGSQRVELGVTCEVDALGRPQLSGAGMISGSIRFDSGQNALYLDDPTVDALKIEKLPPEFETDVKSAATVAVREYFGQHPLYRLKESDVRRFPFGLRVQRVEIRDGELRITLGRGG